MKLKLHVRDRNPQVVIALRRAFADLAGTGAFEAGVGDIFDDAACDAVLSPANSFGYMDGGIDLAYRNRFGHALEASVQSQIRNHHHGELPVGQAFVVPTGDVPIRFLVVAPTMRVPMNVAKTTHAYLAFRAALIAISRFNDDKPRIASLLTPGLCTSIGQMDPLVAAGQMRAAWNAIVEGKRLVRPQDARDSQRSLEGHH